MTNRMGDAHMPTRRTVMAAIGAAVLCASPAAAQDPAPGSSPFAVWVDTAVAKNRDVTIEVTSHMKGWTEGETGWDGVASTPGKLAVAITTDPVGPCPVDADDFSWADGVVTFGDAEANAWEDVPAVGDVMWRDTFRPGPRTHGGFGVCVFLQAELPAVADAGGSALAPAGLYTARARAAYVVPRVVRRSRVVRRAPAPRRTSWRIMAIRAGVPSWPRRCYATIVTQRSRIDPRWVRIGNDNERAERMGCSFADGWVLVRRGGDGRWRLWSQGSDPAPCSVVGRRVAAEIFAGWPCD